MTHINQLLQLLVTLMTLSLSSKIKIKFEDTNWMDECPWDPPSVPINEKDVIGRLKYIANNSTKLFETLSVVKQGKTYSLGRAYTQDMLKWNIGGGTKMERNFSTKLLYDGPIGKNKAFFSQQKVCCTAMGNVATQFDALGQIFFLDNKNPSCEASDSDAENENCNLDAEDPSNWIFYNNFRGDQVVKDWGIKYLGVENVNIPFITRAILLDIAGLKNTKILDGGYEITIQDMKDALKAQNLDIDKDILWGDMIIFYSGWGELFEDKKPIFWLKEPGIGLDIVDFAIENGIVLLGSDAWGLEVYPNPNADIFIPVHHKWCVCHGGYIHELLYLDGWINDARKGLAAWIGAYVYNPVPFKGGVGSPGAPIIML
eukprot:246423_1